MTIEQLEAITVALESLNKRMAELEKIYLQIISEESADGS